MSAEVRDGMPETPMKIMHRGLTIELQLDDPRIPILESVLYGRPLPPPLPMPSLPDTETSVATAAAVPLSPNMRAFWRALTALDRKELTLLSARALRPVELEAALGISQRRVLGAHSRMARFARRHRVPVAVRSRGRGRARRHYWLDEFTAAAVRTLAAEGVAALTP